MSIFKEKITLIADIFPILRTSKNRVKQISKKSTFRGPFKNQHVKGEQTVLKSERHHFYHIYWALLRQLSWKKYLLVTWKVLKMFANIFFANDKYSLLNSDNLRQPIQMQLSQKRKIFSQFVSAFLKMQIQFCKFSEKDNPHSWYISKIRDSETVVNQISKKSPFIDPFGKQHLRGTKHCWNVSHTTLIILIDYCKDNWVEKRFS